MGEELITNNDVVVVPDGVGSTEPLTPDVPVDTQIDTENNLNDKIGIFFGTIQESVTIAWRYHLKTHKHYIHLATQEYYYKALNVVDKIIEEYQGDSGVTVENYINSICDCGKTELEYFRELQALVTASKTDIPWKEEIISDIDELLGAIDSTLYQLTSFNEHSIKSFDEFCFEDYDVIGVEGGVDGVFDNITKTTKTNLAPSGASEKTPKTKKSEKSCEEEEEEEE